MSPEMRMDAQLQPRLEQRMKMSQQMLQSLELLQLPVMDLRELIMQELEQNPTLELAEDVEKPVEEEAAPEAEHTNETRRDGKESEKLDFVDVMEEELDEIPEYRRYRPNQEATEQHYEMLQNIENRSQNLQEYLYQQLILMEISEEVKTIAREIIYNIDDSGYLKFSLEEIAASLKEQFSQLSEPELLDKVSMVLELIHKLEPRGVGARNTRECLLLQLSDEDLHYELKKKLIVNYLEDIGQNRLPKVAKELGMGIEELKIVVDELSHLHLKPGSLYSAEQTIPIHPEVVVKEVEGIYEVWVDDSYLPMVSFNRRYQEMLRDRHLSKEEKDFVRRKLASAKGLVHAIELRKATLYRIALEIVKQQKDFFDQGIEHLKPLTMQQVADALGIHVSTVSRAAAGKYMDTPRGVLSMKFFFASAAEAENGDPKTRLSLLSRIEELVQNEDKQKPLADAELTKLLNDGTLHVARRTVAKLREELHIPSSRLRKQF